MGETKLFVLYVDVYYMTRSTSMVSDKFSGILPGSGTNSPKTGGIRRSESAKDGASEGGRRNQRRGGVRKHSDPYQRQR